MFESNRIVTVNSRKFDNKIHRTWTAYFVEQNSSLLSLVGKFEKEIKHEALGVIGRGTISYEFYWFHRHYNIFRFHEPAGKLRNFYCNLSLRPKLENDVLDYVDLDIDVLVDADFGFRILDSEEYEENAARFSYGNELKNTIEKNLQELLALIKNRQFPFNYKPLTENHCF